MQHGLDWLLALPRFSHTPDEAYVPGQDRIRALLAAMGDPQRGLRTVHIGGTNGKGSTASFVSALGTASGLRVGLFTSPSLLHASEMIRIDGVPQAEGLARAADRWLDAAQASGATFFEILTALALWTFAEADVDLAVVEVGLGGREDATAVVEPIVTAVTHVGLDHMDLLGDTPEAIAVHQAGIARPGVPFLHSVARDPARAALEREASARGAQAERVLDTVRPESSGAEITFHTPDGTVGPVGLGLWGAHQRRNATLALRCAQEAFGPLAPEAAVRGLSEVVALAGVRGRAERWAGDRRIVLDVAHNADGWRAALGAIDATPRPAGTLWALVGAMQDKDVTDLGRLLRARGAHVVVAPLGSPRAFEPGPLAEALGGAEVVASVAAGLDRFRHAADLDDRLLVTGSHTTVAEAIRALESSRTSASAEG